MSTPELGHYVIRGGMEGRERLRLLSRVLHRTTADLLERAGIRPGMRCLDMGCGGGDVTCQIALLVGSDGSVVGADIDHEKIDIARKEAAESGLANVEYRLADAIRDPFPPEFDAVYARFLLTHLPDRDRALETMCHALKPGGILIVEDIDFEASFCWPAAPAWDRYCALYTASVRKRGGEPDLGRQLPAMLLAAGLDGVEVNVVQPAGVRGGEAKLAAPITMEAIAQTVIADGLATLDEVNEVVDELYRLARDERTTMSFPRIVQALGYRGSH